MAESARRPFGHEPASIAGRPIRNAAAILLATVLIVGVVLHWSLRHEVAPDQARVAARQGPIPPLPRLQAHPTEDLTSMRAAQEALLTHYAWLDSAHGAARIPIERAMAIYARQQAPPP
ncbi:MAG TPA: hypothetical protein VHW25_12095 [Steroidobacteraceae bacterium]|jgi:hypothetical protein|nr:hypothetical protein [Steroidobacteraceae bacterium]